MVQRSNYSGAKLMLINLRKDKKAVFTSGVLRTYGVSAPRLDKVTKTYYDTKTLFFRKHGINIAIIKYNDRSYSDLVVRYDSEVSRVNFISGIPDTFIKKIRKGESLAMQFNYIATAILELIPRGLSVDAFEIVRDIKPVVVINKKRERYRIIHNDGLKMVFSFESNTYHNLQNGSKHKMPLLDIRMESVESFKTEFYEYVRKILVNHPDFLAQKHSDLLVTYDYAGLV